VYSIIVKRGDLEHYDLLYKSFSTRVPVIWDRRRRDRRQLNGHSSAGERRGATRRGRPPASWLALGFVVIENDARSR
jgi:hypothetical protein